MSGHGYLNHGSTRSLIGEKTLDVNIGDVEKLKQNVASGAASLDPDAPGGVGQLVNRLASQDANNMKKAITTVGGTMSPGLPDVQDTLSQLIDKLKELVAKLPQSNPVVMNLQNTLDGLSKILSQIGSSGADPTTLITDLKGTLQTLVKQIQDLVASLGGSDKTGALQSLIASIQNLVTNLEGKISGSS